MCTYWTRLLDWASELATLFAIILANMYTYWVLMDKYREECGMGMGRVVKAMDTDFILGCLPIYINNMFSVCMVELEMGMGRIVQAWDSCCVSLSFSCYYTAPHVDSED